MFRKKVVWIGLLILVAMLAVSCQSADEPVETPDEEPADMPAEPAEGALPDLGGRTITIGSDTTYPPFETVNPETNEAEGFDIDMMVAICELVNCQAEIVTAAWDGIFAALAAGEWDVVVSGVTITPERDEIVDFTNSYMRYGQVIMVRADETEVIDVDTLAGHLVGSQLGTTNEAKAIEVVGEDNVKSFETFAVAVEALLAGDVDAIILDSPAADGYMLENPGEMKIVGDLLTSEDLGIVVQEGDAELQDAFNAALDQLIDNGDLYDICDKWAITCFPLK